MTQKILEPTPAELNWIDEHVRIVREMANGEVTAAELDSLWEPWIESWQPGAEDPNFFIDAFGLAFGQILADELRLEWKLVEDEHGSEIALHGSVGEILVFPTNTVAKRFVDRVARPFVELQDWYESQITEVRRKVQESGQ
jgi:hypothetical protein